MDRARSGRAVCGMQTERITEATVEVSGARRYIEELWDLGEGSTTSLSTDYSGALQTDRTRASIMLISQEGW